MENKRDIIIAELETMAKKETVEKNFFKVRAYRKVIDQIKTIEIVTRMDDIASVSGIGTKIRAKLEEIFKTGKLKSAEIARKSKKLETYDIFLKIHGIGVAKAKELVEDHKILTIDSLKEALDLNSDLLNEKQKIGLQYYMDIQLRIPRKEMDAHAKKLNKLIKESEIDPDLNLKIVGSFRRGEQDSGDIDILATIDRKVDSVKRTKILKKIIQYLKDAGYLLADLATGQKKYMGICRLNKKKPARRIDILMTSQEEYPFALLYFTGDFQINVNLRKKAAELGFTLNEYGLKGRNKPEINSEKDIFNFLGFKFLKPKDRHIQMLTEI